MNGFGGVSSALRTPLMKRSSAPGSSSTFSLETLGMITQTVFAELHPIVRTYALVGAYLQSWSIMESKLNKTLGRALGLSNLQSVIVSRNIQMRDKIHITKSLLHLEVFNETERATYLAVANRIVTLSQERNIVAHDLFYADDNGDGVSFFVMKAKGPLAFPDVRWAIKDFADKTEELFNVGLDLDKLGSLMGRLKLAKALAEHPPTGMFGGLGLLGLHPLHTQDTPGLGLLDATPQTDDETPPSSDE